MRLTVRHGRQWDFSVTRGSQRQREAAHDKAGRASISKSKERAMRAKENTKKLAITRRSLLTGAAAIAGAAGLSRAVFMPFVATARRRDL